MHSQTISNVLHKICSSSCLEFFPWLLSGMDYDRKLKWTHAFKSWLWQVFYHRTREKTRIAKPFLFAKWLNQNPNWVISMLEQEVHSIIL